MILLRLISFPTGLGCSYLSPDFLPQSLSLGWEVFYQVPVSQNRRLPRSTELASKKESNNNVMVTRPTNHMILTRDPSHDLDTQSLIWSWHVTYELYPDNQVIINTNIHVITSMSWLHSDLLFVIRLLYLLIITARVVHQLKTKCKPQTWTRKTTLRLTPSPDLVMVAWEGFTSIAINESH